jgi:hypothetical protein
MDQIKDTVDRQELKELLLDLLRVQEQILQRMERIEDALSNKKS